MTSETMIQRSPAHRQMRLGKITASRFVDVLCQPRDKAARQAGRLSKTAQNYLLDLVAEHLTGQEQGPRTTWDMQWGIDNEAGARIVYEELMGREVQEVGFIEHPLYPMIGGSPDGLIGEDGGIEIKCPGNARVHLGYVLGSEVPKEYVAQVQGYMWITGREWWDFVTYDPRIKQLDLALWIHRVEYDSVFVDDLERKCLAFRDRLLETLCQIKGG